MTFGPHVESCAFDSLLGADAGEVALRHLRSCHDFMDAIQYTIERAKETYKIEAYDRYESLREDPSMKIK